MLITALRIPAGAGLLFVEAFSPGFWALYLICGVSDALDGYLARRLGVAGRAGAAFDSVADLCFFGALMCILIPRIDWRPWQVVWVSLIMLLRCAAAAVGYLRFRQPAPLHTWANKASGAALFLLPLGLRLFGAGWAIGLACACASVAAAEELIIRCLAESSAPDTRGLLFERVRAVRADEPGKDV